MCFHLFLTKPLYHKSFKMPHYITICNFDFVHHVMHEVLLLLLLYYVKLFLFFNQVNWADQQYSKSRVKRDLDIMNLVKNFNIGNWFTTDDLFGGQHVKNPYVKAFSDPLWDKQWYMVRIFSLKCIH